jgi:hypothetical protein
MIGKSEVLKEGWTLVDGEGSLRRDMTSMNEINKIGFFTFQFKI